MFFFFSSGLHTYTYIKNLFTINIIQKCANYKTNIYKSLQTMTEQYENTFAVYTSNSCHKN